MNEIKNRICICSILFFMMVLFFMFIETSVGFAADPSQDIITQIHQKFNQKGLEYGLKLKNYALSLFKLFLLVGIVVFGVQVTLSRTDMGDAIKEFIIMLLFAAFCFIAITHYDVWTQWIINKQEDIARNVGGGESSLTLQPIDYGLLIFAMAIKGVNWYEIALYLSMFIIATLILACLCLITARMLVVMCEAYVAMNVAVLMLGFGGAHFAKDYAINVMRYVVSLAVKLLTMQLVIAIGLSFMKEMTTVENVEIQNFIVLFVCGLILLVLVHSLPEAVAGIINGSHVGSGVGLAAAAGSVGRSMAASFVAATTAVAGTGKTVAGVSRAAKIASLQGDGGIGGTASQLWKSYQEARQDEQRAGMRPSAMGELRRMGASITDMHSAAMAQNNPDYRSNEYSSNRYSGNPYSSAPPNAAVRNAAPFGSSAGRAQTEADNRSAGPAGAAPGRTPGADRPAQASGPSSGSSATDDVIQHLKSGSGRGAKQ